MRDPHFSPVIIGVGEAIDRPTTLEQSLEPVALMAQALEAAQDDAGARVLAHVDTLDLVGLVSWRYVDPVGQLAERLGIDPARKTNASMGGATPPRQLHEPTVVNTPG